MMPEIENVFDAAKIGGCPFEPQNKDTEAKEWLQEAINAANDLFEELKVDKSEPTYPEDEVMEMVDQEADRAVEFRTYKAYMIWVQLGGYEYDSDINGDNIPMNKPELIGAVQTDLYEWARNIIAYRVKDVMDV